MNVLACVYLEVLVCDYLVLNWFSGINMRSLKSQVIILEQGHHQIKDWGILPSLLIETSVCSEYNAENGLSMERAGC